jgi:hypothetical protein
MANVTRAVEMMVVRAQDAAEETTVTPVLPQNSPVEKPEGSANQ